MVGVGACWASFMVSRGANDARSAHTPPKFRHVVIPLWGLELRVSTLFCVDTAIPKVFADHTFRVSILFRGSASFVIEMRRP